MDETFKDRLKKAGGCVWWLFGILCLICILIILGGFLICFIGKTSQGIIMLAAGIVCLLFFVGICIVLPYIQWKKGVKANPITLPSNHKIGQISKESILLGMYNQAQDLKKYSLPVSIAIMTIVFLIYNRYNDLTDFSRLTILIIIECVIFLLGMACFISASKWIWNFSNIELEFYKRPVIKKTHSIGIDGEQDKYQFVFEGFRGYHEMVQGVNSSDEITIGDECVLVCHKGSKTIIDMYCMKHWDISEDILSELK